MSKKKSVAEYGQILEEESNWVTATGRNDAAFSEAQELKSVIENEIKSKVMLLLENDAEYQKIIAQLKEYEGGLYKVECDSAFFEGYTKYSPEIYAGFVSVYDNFAAIRENHENTMAELQSQREELLNFLPERRMLLTLSQRRAKAKLTEVERSIEGEKRNMLTYNEIYDTVAESKKKQAETEQWKKQHPGAEKLYAKARKIEEGYVEKYVAEALKKHAFMLNLKYDPEGASKDYMNALGLLKTISYSSNPAGESHDLGLPKILDKQVEAAEQKIIEEGSRGFNS